MKPRNDTWLRIESSYPCGKTETPRESGTRRCKIPSERDVLMSRYMTSEETAQVHLEAMGPDLGPFYSLLVNECSLLHLEWAEYRVLFGTKPERVALLNEAAPTFFFQLQNLMWEGIVLHIARLMDPPNSGENKENVTLRKLPELVDSAFRYKIDILLKVAQEKCAFSQDWRNRHIAHRDLSLARDGNAKPLETASRISVESALEAVADVLNAVEYQYQDNGIVAYRHAIEPLGGATALLQVLGDGLDARRALEHRRMTGQLLPEDANCVRPLKLRVHK